MPTSYREILRLVWPLALGMANNAILQFTDRAFLARESMASLEAALPAGLLASIALGFFQSVTGFSGTFVAQYFGARNLAMCRRSYHAGCWIAVASGVLMLALLPLGDFVFETFSSGAEVIAREKTYYRICAAGGVFLFGQMAVQTYFTGIGRTRIVLAVNVVGNLLNVVLDPLLIFGWCGFPRLGIAGAALATVFATAVQWAALVLAARRIRSTDAASGSAVSAVPFGALVRRILRYGIPSGAYAVLNILSFTVFVFFINAKGHVEAAVSNACFSFSYLLYSPLEGVALGAATLVGHRRGAGDDAGALLTGRRILLLGVAYAALASLFALALRRPILALYAPDNPAAALRFHDLGATLLLLLALWQVFDAAGIVLSGALKGAGDTRFVMALTLIASFVVWLPSVWLVARFNDSLPVLWSTVIVQVGVVCGGVLLRWFRGSWRSLRLV